MSLWEDNIDVRIEGIHILKELKKLGDSFQDFKLFFVKRKANQAACFCAREALTIVLPLCYDVITDWGSSIRM